MLIIKKIVTLSFSLVLLTGTGASAASFVVSPIRVFFNKKLSKDKITIINNGIEKVSLQVTVKKWEQDMSGTSSYHPTKDIIFFPKLFSVKKGEKRVVRLGYKGNVNPNREITYRLFVDEIRSREARKSNSLNLLLKIGVPIFITPDRVREELLIADPVFEKERISVTVKNRGNTHNIIKRVSIQGFSEEKKPLFKKEKRGWYILAGKTTSYTVKVNKEECSGLTKLSINVETQKSALKKDIEVQPGKCR